MVIHGFSVPGRDDTDLITVLEAVPGAILGYAFFMAIGIRSERKEAELAALATP